MNAERKASFASGCALSSLSAMAIRLLAFILATSRCGLSGLPVTRPAPWKDAAAPTRSGSAAAARRAIAPPMQ